MATLSKDQFVSQTKSLLEKERAAEIEETRSCFIIYIRVLFFDIYSVSYFEVVPFLIL